MEIPQNVAVVLGRLRSTFHNSDFQYTSTCGCSKDWHLRTAGRSRLSSAISSSHRSDYHQRSIESRIETKAMNPPHHHQSHHFLGFVASAAKYRLDSKGILVKE
jgi:hypothetical protein